MATRKATGGQVAREPGSNTSELRPPLTWKEQSEATRCQFCLGELTVPTCQVCKGIGWLARQET
jgi:hypothetical protein